MIGRLIFDSDIESFIIRNSCDKIAMLLYNGNSSIINEVGNYIKREDSDFVSYLPKSKYNKVEFNDPFSDGIGRVSIRIGRFVNKFLRKITFGSYNISSKDLEIFVNLYKSYFMRNESSLVVVSGIDILKWYYENNYYHSNDNRFGTLWSSCMRQLDRNKFMKIYADNNVRMLLLMADDGRLLGRALLWDKVVDLNGNEYKFMDRIYTVYDHDVNAFKNWAKNNGFAHKTEQSSRSERYIIKYVDGRPESCNLKLYINLLKHDQNYYPYFDTFKFYDVKTGIFSNSDSTQEVNNVVFSPRYVLVQSNGGLVPPDPEPAYEDDEYEYEDDYNEDN